MTKAEDFEDYSHNRIKRIMEYKKQEMSKQSIEVLSIKEGYYGSDKAQQILIERLKQLADQ